MVADVKQQNSGSRMLSAAVLTATINQSAACAAAMPVAHDRQVVWHPTDYETMNSAAGLRCQVVE
jgi:hypothetical protein